MQSFQNPRLKAAFWILRYNKSLLGKGLLFRRNGHIKVEVYIDVDWENSRDDRRFTLVY